MNWRVSAVINRLLQNIIILFMIQCDNCRLCAQIPEDFTVAYGAGQDELEVGGVFLRIFIAQPGWVLRKPREFLVSLLETLTELLEKNNPNVSSHTENLKTQCLIVSIFHCAYLHRRFLPNISLRVRPWRQLPLQQYVSSARRPSWPTRFLLLVTCLGSWQHSTTRTTACPRAPSASSMCYQIMR